MKLVLLLSVLSFLTACTPKQSDRPSNPLNLPPVGGQENPNNIGEVSQQDQGLNEVLAVGKKAVAWLNLVNEKRDPANRLNLADVNSSNPVPPEKPSVVSTRLILQKFNKRKELTPAAMIPYLFQNQPLTDQLPVEDSVFIETIRSYNSSYQSTIRWLGSQKYLDYYEMNAQYDIRGFYFFQKDSDLIAGLKDFNSLAPDQQKNAIDWLISMCKNSGFSLSDCKAEVEAAVIQNQAKNIYDKYLEQSQKTYNEFFDVIAVRTDLTWNADQSVITQDFVLPEIQKIAEWLKRNVEIEWQWSGFKLLVNYIEQNNFSPFIEFEKGVTPHVSGNTWNKITMDPDYSLDDYDTQWTIRHEFGHVLGFPDCYLEFYNRETEEMVYYTIEPENLMCAWGGHLKESHVQQLKKAYAK